MNEIFFSLSLAGLLGLIVGSFLNVVIYRLPRMMEAQWQPESDGKVDEWASYNLAFPASHCPHCAHPLGWKENIPVLGFLWLKGCCAHCQTPISWRYPAVELITALLFVGVFAQHGWGYTAAAWAGFSAALVALAAIDADTTLLPDAITQPLTWAGLVGASLGLTGTTLNHALWGASVGYLFLWSVYWLFKIVTGKEGMGQGDFKLLAALGAWLGLPALLSLVMIASLTGVAGGVVLRLRAQLSENGQLPFGPFLVLAGFWVMAFGPLPWFHI
jgi:leader peptidase (prepilin peptidase)/N-methyltransferase